LRRAAAFDFLAFDFLVFDFLAFDLLAFDFLAFVLDLVLALAGAPRADDTLIGTGPGGEEISMPTVLFAWIKGSIPAVDDGSIAKKRTRLPIARRVIEF